LHTVRAYTVRAIFAKKDSPFNKLVLANPWGKAILRVEVVRERRAQALISLLHLPICPFAEFAVIATISPMIHYAS
jgi:hypothetical protein